MFSRHPEILEKRRSNAGASAHCKSRMDCELSHHVARVPWRHKLSHAMPK